MPLNNVKVGDRVKSDLLPIMTGIVISVIEEDHCFIIEHHTGRHIVCSMNHWSLNES